MSAIISFQFLRRVNSNLVNFNANYIDLIYSTAIKHLLSSPLAPTISISNSYLSEIFKTSEAANILKQYSILNSSQQQFNFYTNGSVINIRTDQCTIGIGWV